MNRRLLAFAAILVALPLMAFPVASLPTDPDPQFVAMTHGINANVDEERVNGQFVAYENLTADERTFFDAILETDDRHRVPLDELPGRFQTLDSDADPNVFVVHEGTHYRMFGHTTDPGPPMAELLPRLLSFVVAAGLTSVGGMLYVNTDG